MFSTRSCSNFHLLFPDYETFFCRFRQLGKDARRRRPADRCNRAYCTANAGQTVRTRDQSARLFENCSRSNLNWCGVVDAVFTNERQGNGDTLPASYDSQIPFACFGTVMQFLVQRWKRIKRVTSAESSIEEKTRRTRKRISALSAATMRKVVIIFFGRSRE